MKSKRIIPILFILILSLFPTFPFVESAGYGEDDPNTEQFTDDYTNENNITIKENIVRNSTYDAMELNYTEGEIAIPGILQIREHDRIVAYTPNMIYTLAGTYLQCASGTTSLGFNWWIITANAEWLDGKYIRLNWYHSGYSVARVRIYDGFYNRSDMTLFPNHATIVEQGNGLLMGGDIATVEDGQETDDAQIDTSGAALDTVSIMIWMSDSWTAQSMTMRLYWVEINDGAGGAGNILSWDMGTGGTTLTMEVSGTHNDYGRVDGGDIATVQIGGYAETGYFYTTQVLDNINGSSLALLTNATLNSGSITVEFSSDNSTWVNHNNQSGSETIVDGYEAIDLRDLNFTTLYMRYNFTRGGALLTPRLYQIRVITNAIGFQDDYENEDHVDIKEDMIRNSTLSAMELNYSTAIIRIKEYANYTVEPQVESSFQYREHRIWGGTYTWTSQTFTANDFREGNAVTSYKIAGWLFLTVDREWLDGKYVRFNWYKWGLGFSGGASYTTPRFRIYDGEYDRHSLTDFPIGSAPLTKGSGGLMYEKHRGGSNCNNWYIEDVLVDVSSGNQTYCTLMWADYDYIYTTRLGMIIDYIQINGASGGGSNIWQTDFESASHNLYLEVSGTLDDYGLFNQTEGLYSGGYNEDGYFYTDQVLDNINGSSLALLTNATLDNGVITVEFSPDNSTWVDHNNQSGSETIVAGYEAIDLRDLNVTTLYMRYNFTRGSVLTTPRLYQIRVITTSGAAEDGEPPIIVDEYNYLLIALAITLSLIIIMLGWLKYGNQ